MIESTPQTGVPRDGTARPGVCLAIVGDIAWHGPTAEDPLAAAGRLAPGVREMLRADLVVANLENVLCDDLPAGASGSGALPICGPTAVAEALRWLGVDAVTLANNHLMDYGPAAVASTLRALEAHEVAHFGGGMDLAQATRALLIERHGLRVGFLGFGGTQVPTRRRPGSMPLDCPAASKLIRRVRRDCDLLVVYFHEGIEALHYPMGSTVRACHKAVECGADLVVGTHPHVIQGIETYRSVPIVYSLGNFLTPMVLADRYQRWAAQTDLTRLGVAFEQEAIRQGLVLRCSLAPGRPAAVEPIAVHIQDPGFPAMPTPAQADQARQLLARISEAFAHSEDPAWARRDGIERGYRGLQRKDVSWKFVLTNLHKLRWRHLVAYAKMLGGG